MRTELESLDLGPGFQDAAHFSDTNTKMLSWKSMVIFISSTKTYECDY